MNQLKLFFTLSVLFAPTTFAQNNTSCSTCGINNVAPKMQEIGALGKQASEKEEEEEKVEISKKLKNAYKDFMIKPRQEKIDKNKARVALKAKANHEKLESLIKEAQKDLENEKKKSKPVAAKIAIYEKDLASLEKYKKGCGSSASCRDPLPAGESFNNKTYNSNLNAMKKLEDQNELHQKFISASKENQDKAIAEAMGDKDCAGMRKKATFSSRPGINDPKSLIGEYASEDDAEEALNEVLENNPSVSQCKIDSRMVTLNAKPDSGEGLPKIPEFKPVIRASGNVFADNSKQLTPASQSIINNGFGDLKAHMSETDAFGREIQHKIKKINIYTCASTYRNCSPGSKGTAAWTEECAELDKLRSDPNNTEGEMALWKRLSEMRSKSVEKEVRAQMEAQGLSTDGVVFNVVAGADPNDEKEKQMDNGNGSCGPLPPADDPNESFWKGNCKKTSPASCGPYSKQCEELSSKYKAGSYSRSIADEKIDSAKMSLAKNGVTNPRSTQTYENFRFFKIVPDMESTVKTQRDDEDERSKKSLPQEVWSLRCNELRLSCSKKKIEMPSISLGWGLGGGGIARGGRGGGGGKADSCWIPGAKTFNF